MARPKKEVSEKKEPKFIAIGKIKEDGKTYKAGDEYKGKNAKDLIQSGYVEAK